MPRQHIDGSPLAANGERALHRATPTQGFENLHRAVDHSCVRSVEQSVELLAAPPEADVQFGAQSARQPIERNDRKPAQGAALQARDHALR